MNTQQHTQNTVQIIESVQEVSKQKDTIGHLSPTHLDYWRGRIFNPTYSRNGATHTTPNYACKIQARGRRESFGLQTPNADSAARKARDIYLCVIGSGWEEALKLFKPKPAKVGPKMTVGEFTHLAKLTGLFSTTTFNSYVSKLRTLVAWISGIGSGRANGVRIREWRAKIDQQMLNTITLGAVKDFKREYLGRFSHEPARLRRAQVTMDGYTRNLRALFREAVLKEITELGATVPPMPFEDVTMVVKGVSGFCPCAEGRINILRVRRVGCRPELQLGSRQKFLYPHHGR